MAATIQNSTLIPDIHAQFNGCDMYKDGRESPSITAEPLFKLAVKYLVERANNSARSSFVYSYAKLTDLENQVIPQGLPVEKISILHVPGVGLFPDNFEKAIHDSGYTPSSLSRDIISYLLPISTGDPGTRTKSPTAKIIPWGHITIDLSPIGYEGITVSYNFDNTNERVQITITIPNNVPNSNGQPIVIDSIRSYTDFKQINGGIDYFGAGNNIKNTAIIAIARAAAAANTLQDTASAIIEIMKYLIGKALGDTLQAIELLIASQMMPAEYNNQNTCGFTTDRVLTCRYKSVNQSVCLQVGKESGVKKIELYRGGNAAQLLQQIKQNYIARAIKNNNNVKFVITSAYILSQINVSGNIIPMRPGSPLRGIFDRIIDYIDGINTFLGSIDTANGNQPEDDIRMISAACTASHVFKAGTNKLINIKDLFFNLSAYATSVGVPPTLKLYLGFTGSFSEYIYSQRMTGGQTGGDPNTRKSGKTGTKTTGQKAIVKKENWDLIRASRKALGIKSPEQKLKEKAIKKALLRRSRISKSSVEMSDIVEVILREQKQQKIKADEVKYIQQFEILYKEDATGGFIKSLIGEVQVLQQLSLREDNRSQIRDIVSQYFITYKLPHTAVENPAAINQLIDVIVNLIIFISEEEAGIETAVVQPISLFHDPIDFEDSYNLITLIICSIISLCEDQVFITQINELLSKEHISITTNESGSNVSDILSSEFIEPIYYNLYSRFNFDGYAIFNFDYIQYLVRSYIQEESQVKYFLPSVNDNDDIYSSSRIAYRVLVAIDRLSVSNEVLNNVLQLLKQMALNSNILFPEMRFTEADFSEPASVTAPFSQPYGGSRRKPNKSIHNKKLKNTHKLNKKLNKKTRKGKKTHRKTYKKK